MTEMTMRKSKKAAGLSSKTTTITLFCIISLPSMQDWSVKMSSFTFYGKCTHVTMDFSFPF